MADRIPPHPRYHAWIKDAHLYLLMVAQSDSLPREFNADEQRVLKEACMVLQRHVKPLPAPEPPKTWTCPTCKALLGWPLEYCEGGIDIADPELGETEDKDETHERVYRPGFLADQATARARSED